MNKTAITDVNPAAACPVWCTAGHERDTLIPDHRGGWDALHYSPPAAVQTCEQLPEGVAKTVTVQTETYVCETPSECRPRVVWVCSVDEWGNTEAFAVTARQALRLAEVLVQQAATILAEETTTGGVGPMSVKTRTEILDGIASCHPVADHAMYRDVLDLFFEMVLGEDDGQPMTDEAKLAVLEVLEQERHHLVVEAGYASVEEMEA